VHRLLAHEHARRQGEQRCQLGAVRQLLRMRDECGQASPFQNDSPAGDFYDNNLYARHSLPSTAARLVMRSLVLAAMLLTSFSAQACDLSLVAPAKSPLKKPVQVKASLADDIMTTSYSVTAPSLNATKVFGPGQYPYTFDVVFVRHVLGDRIPLFRVRVSPYNQNYQVKILAHAQHQEGVDLGLVSTATIRPTRGWDAELKIPLKPLGWDGDPNKIRGNFYSILRRGLTRSYWSTFLPRAKYADFHQPQFFETLLRCG
jgi:hypothetical protein